MAKRNGPKDPTSLHTIDYRKSERSGEAPSRHDIATSACRVVGPGSVDETADQGREPTPSDSAHTVAPTLDTFQLKLRDALVWLTRTGAKKWNDVVAHYADAIQACGDAGPDFWGPVNAALVERWSTKTRDRVKRLAWKQLSAEVPRG